MKRIYISILFVFVLTFANAQSYEIDAYNGQTVSTCAGTFYDSGGSAANYSNGETYTVTFCSANVGEQITVAFSSFITQGTLDKLAVYEGGPTSTSLKGTYSGTLSAFSVTSSTGCLTFKFTSDGTTNKAGWIAALSCAPSQPSTCVNAGPFCTGSTESYPATTGITGAQSEFPSGIGCLYTTPNPVYYYLKISNTGSLVINMSSADASGTGNDVDFICWGPFTDPTSNCIAGLNSSTEVDCSYSTAAAETCTIPSAVVGQYYLLLLTNYANVASNITFSQTSGVGATDCNIVNPTCVISAVTATPSACNATTNTYSLSGSVTFADAPSTGTLTVTDGNGHTQTFTAPFTSPTAYSFTGITSNGASVTITASFSGDPDCNNTTTYTAPASCATCSVEAGPNVTICSGTGTTLTATGGSVWSWTSSPTTTITNPTAASITVSPTATTRYTVVATTNGTCTAGDFVDVTVNPIPAAPTVTTPVTYCQSTTATALSATTTGTLNWYGTSATGGTASTTAPIPSTTTVGTTTYYVSQTINGCEGPRASISVTVNATPVAPTVAPVTYCQNATAIALNATVTGTVNWYGTNATGGTASTTAPIPSTSTAGTTNYYVSQTINGCEGPRASITVTVNATPAAPTVAPVTYCQNATAIALNATVTGTVNWYGTNATGGTASTTAPIPSTSIAGTTNYYVSQTINGCEGPRASITVTVNATPTLPTVTTPVSYCQNTTAVALSATPSTGGALNWYGTNATGGTASTTAPIPSTSTAGTTSYYVSQTIAGCEGPREVIIVTINPAPNVTVTNPAPVCSPLTVDITATAITTGSTTGLSYTYWTNASATSSYSTPAAATNGTYYIKGTTSFGCYDIKPVIVTVNPTPTINVDPASASICAGSTQILTASSTVTGTTYEWTGGSTLNPSSFSPTSTTNIYVTGTVNGCKNVSFSVVTVNPVPIVSILPTAPSICNGSTQLLTASSTLPGTTWLWSGGSTANPASFTPNTTTTISVVGTLNNCKDTAYTVITVNPIPTVSITPAISSICIGSSQTLTGLSSVIGTSYSWSTGELTNSITLSPTTTSIITVTGVANGCTNTASATINVNPIPTSSFTFNSPVCQGEDASISYTGSASPSATYTWNFGGGVITSGSGQGPYEVHWNTAGTFNITLAVTENGCTSPITSQPITVNPIPLSTFTASSPICVYNSSNIIYTGGASINASYYWNFAGATVLSGSGQGPFQIQWDTPGTYDISLTVSENNCTSIVTNKTVVVYPKPTSTFQVQTPVCVNEPSQIVYTGTASSTAGYHWNFSGTTATTGANQGPYTATWDTPGTYNVSLYVIENGCYSDSSTMQVEVMPLPLVAFSANPTAGCIPVSVQFTDISPDATSWTWNFGDPTSGSNSSLVQNPTHVYNEANSYNVSLTIEGSNGCVNSLTNNSMITGYPLPQAEFYNLPEVGSLENSNITFYPSGSSSNIVAWSWDFGDFYTSDNYSNLESPSHTYQHTGNYTITLLAETEYGCKDSVQKTILIREDFAIYIPNAFTPNGDFANETFGPQGVGYDENYYKLEIYDRWGELVFSTTDITKHWDGKFQGKTSKQDVYNWVIDIKEKDGIKHHFTGVVTLIL